MERIGVLDSSKEAIQLMEQFSWPGNVRQLRNEIQRIVAFAENEL